MWSTRFELGVRVSLFAAVLSAACDRPELNDSTSLDYAADPLHGEDTAQGGVKPDERQRDRERMEIAVLHGSSTWFERKRADAELPKVRWAANCGIHRACPIGTRVVLDNRGTAAELKNSEHALGLAGYECNGDDSKGCCNVMADGRAVIARGRLVETGGGVESHEPLWELREASLCTLPGPSTGKRRGHPH